MRRGLGILMAALIALPGVAAAQERVLGGALACAPSGDLTRCTGARAVSWDGARLDADVYLPAGREGPLPLVAILGGYPSRKIPAEQRFLLPSPASFARRGYAVLTFAARGMTTSCGPQADCEGESHLADSRYEARDVQHLAGVLADEGVATDSVGVVGESYGGGTALQLAVLRDRVHLPDGGFAPWVSPAGRPMRIAATAPLTTWSDLAGALVKGGRDGVIGVPLASYFTAFTAVGIPDVRNDLRSAASLQRWWATMQAGEPFGDAARAEMDEYARFHSAGGIPLAGPPAPTLLASGLTDDLFPVQEVRRHVDRLLGAVVAEVHGEFGGHGRTWHDPAHAAVVGDRVHAFFDRHVRAGEAPAPEGVEVLVPTCGTWAGDRVHAASWEDLASRSLLLRSGPAQLVTSGGNPLHGRALDPAAIGVSRCEPQRAVDAPGTATFTWPAGGRFLIGTPEVTATLTVTGAPPEHSQLAARLWDVNPVLGKQRLVSRALHRPRGGGPEEFELHGAAYRFPPGHLAKLELLTSDVPYGRPGNLPFAVRVSGLELRLPVR